LKIEKKNQSKKVSKILKAIHKSKDNHSSQLTLCKLDRKEEKGQSSGIQKRKENLGDTQEQKTK
jgi:hypothetical protein